MKSDDLNKRTDGKIAGKEKETGSEELFKWIASDYAEEYGRRLNEELAELQRQNFQGPDFKGTLSPGAEERILRQVNGQKNRKRNRRIKTGIAAACILLLLIVPFSRMFYQSENGSGPGGFQDTDSAEGPGGIADREFEWIALADELPQGFSIRGEEQDREKTIYYLAEKNFDDVVLTLEKVADGPFNQGLRQSEINGATVYGLENADYNLLTFIKDGIRYTMTCQYEMSTLLALSYSIL